MLQSSTTYYEKGSEEAVAETALTIKRLEQVSAENQPRNPRFKRGNQYFFYTSFREEEKPATASSRLLPFTCGSHSSLLSLSVLTP